MTKLDAMPSKFSPRGGTTRPMKCRECGAKAEDGAEISRRGLCLPCGIERQNMAALQLNAQSGPVYDQWCESMADFGRRLAARS